jgi:serine protease Do
MLGVCKWKKEVLEMYKKWLFIPVASVSFVLLLTLGLLLNLGTHGTASDETGSSAELRELVSLNSAFVKVAKDITQSVVNVNTTSVVERSRAEPRFHPFFRDFFGEDFFREFRWSPRSQRRTSLGSGVIIDEDGYILTNNHVITGEGEAHVDEIKVILSDKREFDAELIGRDPDTDVAVIKIDAKDLPTAKLGDSEQLQVGEWVLAIGRPLGLSQTVTAGIVSATGRSNVLDTITYQDFIQTDASINRGNSGGPLVNIKGEVVGLNTAIATAGAPGNIGIGFSIPINMAREVMDQLIKKGRVVRGWLGIQLQEVDGDIAEKYGLEEPSGVLIALVIDDPAKEAGLEPGDLIIEFSGEAVRDGSHLKRLVAIAGPDKAVKLKVIRRSGKKKEFEVKLAERTEEVVAKLGRGGRTPSEKEEEWMGITVQELTDELAQQLGYEDQPGVLISDVDTEGPAAKAKNPPQRGDLIQEIEREEIKNMDDYRQAIEKVKDQKSILIRLRRATGVTWYVVLKKK